MELHADFAKRAVVRSNDLAWVASPMPGVDRRPLDRIGGEVARATSIVRYAPDSRFSAHVHAGGEEFFVLDGVFQDEHGDYPAGTYVRNPVGSRHTPGSAPGCTIFVKLWQFDPADQVQMRQDMNAAPMAPVPGVDGIRRAELFRSAEETVAVETWAAGARSAWRADGGAEVFVLEGSVTDAGDHLPERGWLRVPDGGPVDMEAGPDGARLWVKTGHLRHIRLPG